MLDPMGFLRGIYSLWTPGPVRSGKACAHFPVSSRARVLGNAQKVFSMGTLMPLAKRIGTEPFLVSCRTHKCFEFTNGAILPF